MTRATTTRSPAPPRRPRRWGHWTYRVLAVALVVPLVMFGFDRVTAMLSDAGQGSNPFRSVPLFVPSESGAARAASQAGGGENRILQRLAKVPTAVWLTPEKYRPGMMRDDLGGVVTEADQSGRVLVVVIYGITDRDCSGGFSSGGLAAEQYVAWVREIAGVLEKAGPVAAILEPDAVAAATQCADVDQRVALLSAAVDALRDAHVTTYVDAGHSDWVPATQMADLLKRVGADRVRGFAVNVSGYGASGDEHRYAESVSEALGGAHYVVDTSRNGAGSTGEWCNPPGRSLGAEPGYVDDSSHQDANLWIKPPGESDGPCNGGPEAGQWWTANALDLARSAGW